MAFRATCTDHCGGCGRHFHGLKSFEAHRQDGECKEPEGLTNTKGVLVLQVWTLEGVCDRELGCYEDGKRVKFVEPVTIWQGFQTEADRARIRELNSKRPDSNHRSS